MAPVTVLIAVGDPVRKIPSLEDVPDEEPVPIKVIGALLVVVIEPAAAREIPRFDVVVPLPVPVRLIPLPIAVVMRELEPVTKIPSHPLVPVPPRQVPVIEPLVELILPPEDTSRPLLPVDAALLLPAALTMMLPETVVTAELEPLTTMPRLLFPPVGDAVPLRVMLPIPVALNLAEENTPMPSALAPVPPPLPVTEVRPSAV